MALGSTGAVADTESDPHLSEVYRRLAAVEEAYAEFWRRQLQKMGPGSET